MTEGPARTSGPEVVLHEEHLQVTTNRVATERLLLRKVVVTETRQVEVTVRREELQIQRLPADGTATHQPVGTPAQPLVIVLSQEVPVVQLLTRPYERVTVHVDTVTDHQQITQTLSHERADISTDQSPTHQSPTGR